MWRIICLVPGFVRWDARLRTEEATQAGASEEGGGASQAASSLGAAVEDGVRRDVGRITEGLYGGLQAEREGAYATQNIGLPEINFNQGWAASGTRRGIRNDGRAISYTWIRRTEGGRSAVW